MQRRTLFKLGIASATVLVLAGGAAALIEPGLTGGRLSASGREVFSSVGRAVLDKSIPADVGARQIALNGLLTRIDTLVAGLPPHAQAELSQLLSLLASSGGRRCCADRARARARAPQRVRARGFLKRGPRGAGQEYSGR